MKAETEAEAKMTRIDVEARAAKVARAEANEVATEVTKAVKILA